MATIYETGAYLAHNPDWHEADSPWKAGHVLNMLKRNEIVPRKVVEIGCGAGGILAELGRKMTECDFVGYDISPQAIELCGSKATSNVHFVLGRRPPENAEVDVVLAMDVAEHVEDYFSFFRDIRSFARRQIYHIPLELSAQSVVRRGKLLHARKVVGHIHYFTAETALASLSDTGHTIVDWFYTSTATDLTLKSFKQRIAYFPRRLAFAINPEIAVRVLGGYSMLVLCEADQNC